MALCVAVFGIVFPVCGAISFFLFGPAGVLSALLSALLVAEKISTAISMLCFGPKIQQAAFDRVLSEEGDVELLKKLEMFRKENQRTFTLEVVTQIPRKLPFFICRELTFTLLNFVPFVGTALVLYLRAPRKGLRTHRRYFNLMSWQKIQAKEFYRAHKGDYTGYGIVASLLELIPAFTVVFIFTGNISMALWTVDNHETFSREADEFLTTQYK